MKLDPTFPMMEFSPPIDRKAQGYRRGVECVHIVGYEEVLDTVSLLSGNSHHAVGELLKDAYLANLVGLAEVAACNTFAKAQMMECRLERSKRNDEVSKPIPIGQLAKDENQQVVPIGKTFDILVALVLIN
jgi:hypothetical protein